MGVNAAKHFIKDRTGIWKRLFNPFEPEPIRVNWDDMLVGASAAGRAVAGAPSLASFDPGAGGGSIQAYLFAGNLANTIHFPVQLSHRYKQGTFLRPHVHWCQDGTDTGAVGMTFEYTYANVNGDFVTPISEVISVAAPGIAYRHKATSLEEIRVGGLTVSSILMCRLTRDGNTDANNDGVFILYVDLHIRMDSFGSREEFVK